MKDHRPPSIWPLLLSFSLSLFLSSAHAYELWSLPIESELKTLKITNLTSQPQSLWAGDVSQRIPAFGTFDLPLNQFPNQTWLPLKAESNQLFQIQIETSYETQTLLNPGSQTRWKIRIRPESDLVIFNQAPFEQKILLSAPGNFSEFHQLKAFEKKRFRLPPFLNGALLTLSGEARLGGFLISASGPKSLLPDPAPVSLKPDPEAKYFRLTNKSGSQSYVVALDDPTLISQARKQIQEPKAFLPRILLGKVGFGNGNFNRDFSSSSKALWSWHLTEVFRFAELASQECDGSPQMLEENLLSWTQGSSVICFWSYRIVEELSLQKVQTGR